MRGGGEEERGIVGVEGALELSWGGSGMGWEWRGANQEESSCWKVMVFFVVVVDGGVGCKDGRFLTLIQWLFR